MTSQSLTSVWVKTHYELAKRVLSQTEPTDCFTHSAHFRLMEMRGVLALCAPPLPDGILAKCKTYVRAPIHHAIPRYYHIAMTEEQHA